MLWTAILLIPVLYIVEKMSALSPYNYFIVTHTTANHTGSVQSLYLRYGKRSPHMKQICINIASCHHYSPYLLPLSPSIAFIPLSKSFKYPYSFQNATVAPTSTTHNPL